MNIHAMKHSLKLEVFAKYLISKSSVSLHRQGIFTTGSGRYGSYWQCKEIKKELADCLLFLFFARKKENWPSIERLWMVAGQSARLRLWQNGRLSDPRILTWHRSSSSWYYCKRSWGKVQNELYETYYDLDSPYLFRAGMSSRLSEMVLWETWQERESFWCRNFRTNWNTCQLKGYVCLNASVNKWRWYSYESRTVSEREERNLSSSF